MEVIENILAGMCQLLIGGCRLVSNQEGVFSRDGIPGRLSRALLATTRGTDPRGAERLDLSAEVEST